MAEFAAVALACVRGGRLVFTGLTFQAMPGSALVLRGPNGSGKSSLLRLLAGLARPAHGAVTWDGVDVRDAPDEHHGRLHYVGHLDAVKPVLSVREQVAGWARLRGQSRTDAEDGASAALDRLAIAHLADVPGRYLSAGQRRRVALARVLAAPSAIWLLDEPRTALDADASSRLEAAIAEHRKHGGMVVLSLHEGRDPEGADVLDLSGFAPRDEPSEGVSEGAGATW